MVEDVFHQSGQAAAMADDDQLQFPPQRMARHDAEVASDVSDDGADRASADLGCDLLGRGQEGEIGLVVSVGMAAARAGGDWRREGARGGAGARSGRAALRISLASSASARSRPRVMRARICAMSLALSGCGLPWSVVASCLP